MPDQPKHPAGDPELEADADRGGQGAIGDGDGARGAAEQDRLGERPMHRGVEDSDFAILQQPISAPPPQLTNDRMKPNDANAIYTPQPRPEKRGVGDERN